MTSEKCYETIEMAEDLLKDLLKKASKDGYMNFLHKEVQAISLAILALKASDEHQ